MLPNQTNLDLIQQKLQNCLKELQDVQQTYQSVRHTLEVASRYKNDFMVNMNHEIRTPLNGILGMLTLAMETDLTPQQQEYLEIASYSADTLLSLLNDLLDYSKVETGQLILDNIDFDLRKIVEEVTELLANKAAAKKIELNSLLSANLPETVNGDPTRFRQILINLVGNAIKFTDQGEVAIRVRLIEGTDYFLTIRCEVRDTGIGIAPDLQNHIFDSFTQADTSITRSHGGTGLGLALSKQLVERMGGKIGVDSTLGKGSTFWFTVTFNKPHRQSPPVLQPCVSLRGLRALIVDDDAINCKILEHHFGQWGIQYHRCKNGKQALAALYDAIANDLPYDFAILDMRMEELNGLNLSYAIKHNPLISSTRLILLSSHAQRGDAQVARKVGFSAYLTKPVRKATLYDAITLVMGLTADQKSILITRHTIKELGRQNECRILLVEDNIFNQKVMLGILKQSDIHVDVANNGQEAIDALLRQTYDLVFMDCQMPIMDGYQATAKIRQQEHTHGKKHTPILAFTANTSEADRDRCLAAGMDDYFLKPCKPEALQRILQKWIIKPE